MKLNSYDSFAHYFDLFSGQAMDDLPVYTGFAQRTGGPALELGCGSGRIALALAQEGYDVTGVDDSAEMLNIARRKVAQAGLRARVALLQADLRDLDLAPPLTPSPLPARERREQGGGVREAPRFKLAICAQNTFCHMLSTADQLRMLRTAGRHLESGGLLVLDVFNPDPANLANHDRRLILMGVTTDPDTGHQFTQTLSREIDAGAQIEHVTMFVDEMDGARLADRRVFEFDLRYVYRFELELLLDKAGFELEALYGSYDLEPFHGESERLLAVAKWANT